MCAPSYWSKQVPSEVISLATKEISSYWSFEDILRSEGIPIRIRGHEVIHFSSWDEDIKKIKSKVTEISAEIKSLKANLEKIQHKENKWKMENPVKSFLLRAAKVSGFVLYKLFLVLSVVSVLGIPLYFLCKGADRMILDGRDFSEAHADLKKNEKIKNNFTESIDYAIKRKKQFHEEVNIVCKRLKIKLDKGCSNWSFKLEEKIKKTIKYLEGLNLG